MGKLESLKMSPKCRELTRCWPLFYPRLVDWVSTISIDHGRVVSYKPLLARGGWVKHQPPPSTTEEGLGVDSPSHPRRVGQASTPLPTQGKWIEYQPPPPTIEEGSSTNPLYDQGGRVGCQPLFPPEVGRLVVDLLHQPQKRGRALSPLFALGRWVGRQRPLLTKVEGLGINPPLLEVGYSANINHLVAWGEEDESLTPFWVCSKVH